LLWNVLPAKGGVAFSSIGVGNSDEEGFPICGEEFSKQEYYGKKDNILVILNLVTIAQLWESKPPFQ
jgi:hypothetical protein